MDPGPNGRVLLAPATPSPQRTDDPSELQVAHEADDGEAELLRRYWPLWQLGHQ